MVPARSAPSRCLHIGVEDVRGSSPRREQHNMAPTYMKEGGCKQMGGWVGALVAGGHVSLVRLIEKF